MVIESPKAKGNSGLWLSSGIGTIDVSDYPLKELLYGKPECRDTPLVRFLFDMGKAMAEIKALSFQLFGEPVKPA